MTTPTRFKQLQVGDRKNAATGESLAMGHAVVSQSNTIAYTNAAVAKDLFILPAKSQIIEIYVDVLTAFNSSGTDLLDIGVSGDADKFADNLDLASAARLRGTSDVSQLAEYDDIGDSQITVQGLYSQSVADADAGSARITILYIPGNNLE